MTLTDARSVTTPSAGELVARIRKLQPLLAENSAQGEKDPRVVVESIQALTEAPVGRDDQITPLI